MTETIRSIHRKCLEALLRPAIRYCLRNSFTIQDITSIVKLLLIEHAVGSINESSEKINYSRLSIMTGIHRQDVKRLYLAPTKVDTSTSYIRKIIGQWEQDSRFCKKDGSPKVLSIEGEEASFRELVRSVTVDVNPMTVLFELERIDAIRRVKRGIALNRFDQLISDDPENGLRLLARDTHDLTIALEENILGEHETRNLQGRTMYDNVYRDALPQIREWMLAEGSAFHRRARDYLSQFDKDINTDPKREGGAKVIVANYSRTIEADEN